MYLEFKIGSFAMELERDEKFGETMILEGFFSVKTQLPITTI